MHNKACLYLTEGWAGAEACTGLAVPNPTGTVKFVPGNMESERQWGRALSRQGGGISG